MKAKFSVCKSFFFVVKKHIEKSSVNFSKPIAVHSLIHFYRFCNKKPYFLTDKNVMGKSNICFDGD